jgi:hypothetical protein
MSQLLPTIAHDQSQPRCTALHCAALHSRPLLLLSTTGICFALLLMAAASSFERLNGLMVFAMCLFMAFFSIGTGPLTCMCVLRTCLCVCRGRARVTRTQWRPRASEGLNQSVPPLLHRSLARGAGVGATEVFSTRIRAKALALAVSAKCLVGGVLALTTLPLLSALTSR